MLGEDSEAGGPITRMFADAFQGDQGGRTDALVELNIQHRRGIEGAVYQFRQALEIAKLPETSKEMRIIGDIYVPCRLSLAEAQRLVTADRQLAQEVDHEATLSNSGGASYAAGSPRGRSIERIWPDSDIEALLDDSDRRVIVEVARHLLDRVAARLSPDASPIKTSQGDDIPLGQGVRWAVIDSGIDSRHPHFDYHQNLVGVEALHRDFTQDDGDPLEDETGHGTHVAGTIAGGLPFEHKAIVGKKIRNNAGDFDAELLEDEGRMVTRAGNEDVPSGVAPKTKLVSLKVFDMGNRGKVSRVIEALEYVRKQVNQPGAINRIHGVNLSLGYPYNQEWNACGWTPLCREVDNVVQSGVVVVVAAGNSGYGKLKADLEPGWSAAMGLTINDPGNAERAITVGSTYGPDAQRYGVSCFSSKGPTADGRWKPDLIAPGERVVSCAGGENLTELGLDYPYAFQHPVYVEQSGTSMAAPHVSGAIAAFLSVHSDYIGRPENVKQRFLEHAVSLGRDRYFQGHGMVDLGRVVASK